MSTRRRMAVSLVAALAAAGVMPLTVGTGTASAEPAPAQCPSTPSYDYTIPTSVGPPVAVSLSGDDFADTAYAAIGADRQLYYVDTSLDAGDESYQLTVSQLACLGGQETDVPGLTVGPDGTRAFFVRTPSGRLFQRYVTTNYSSLGAWHPINAAMSTNGPAAVLDPDGGYHLFIRSQSGALYHGYKEDESYGSWRWERLGGQILGAPVAILDGDTFLVAAVGRNHAIYTIRGNTGTWGPFMPINNKVGDTDTQIRTNSQPALMQDPQGGDVTMFAVSRTGGLYAVGKGAESSFNGQQWDQLDDVLPPDARIAAATNGDDVVVYARFLDQGSGEVLTAYTEYLGATEAWSDYYLAPYTCFECAPFGVDTSAAPASAAAKDKAAHSPGGGRTARMPATRKVLG